MTRYAKAKGRRHAALKKVCTYLRRGLREGEREKYRSALAKYFARIPAFPKRRRSRCKARRKAKAEGRGDSPVVLLKEQYPRWLTRLLQRKLTELAGKTIALPVELRHILIPMTLATAAENEREAF